MKARTVVVGNLDDRVLGLDELDERAAAEHRRRQAADLWTVLAIVGLTLCGNFLRLWQPLRLARVSNDRRPVHAGEIRLAVHRARRRPTRRRTACAIGGDAGWVFSERAELCAFLETDIEIDPRS